MKAICGAGFLCLAAVLASGQAAPSIKGVPGALSWRNAPSAWNIDQKKVLTIASGAKSDWFVDPFDGTVANNAPILYFTPGSGYVLSARVNVKFATKWDAGAKLPTMRAELETFLRG